MSEKRLDAKNRWRNVVVAFRMSPEEAQELNVKVSLSGLSKQDYIIQCLLKHEIRVVGGMKVAKKVQVHLDTILEELQTLDEADRGIDVEELLVPLKDDGRGNRYYGCGNVVSLVCGQKAPPKHENGGKKRHHISNRGGTLTTTYHMQGAGAPAKTENYVNADAFIFFREKVRPFPHLAKPISRTFGKDEKAMVQIKRDWFDTALENYERGETHGRWKAKIQV